MKLKKRHPKGSNIYNTKDTEEYTTPLGSYLSFLFVSYKHIIPSGLETEIQNNLKGLRYE